MIKDLLTKWSKVNLFTRPRRFGKSLNMSMLKCFLEIGCNPALFEGLTISGEKQFCEQYMGKFPVISISLKGISGADYWSARSLICSVIGEEALRYSELLSSSRLSKGDANAVQQRFSAYLNKTISIRDPFVKKSAKENFYHGIMLGILGYKSGWYVRSNKETGNGYSDIFIKDEENTGIILEIKYAENGKYESACKNALHQINVCGYADRLKSEGCSKILKYGIACFKKQCQVVVEIDGD